MQPKLEDSTGLGSHLTNPNSEQNLLGGVGTQVNTAEGNNNFNIHNSTLSLGGVQEGCDPSQLVVDD